MTDLREPTDGDVRRAAQLLAETREEITRADSKAATILAATGVAGSVIAAAIVAGQWSPNEMGAWTRLLWWVGAVLGLFGIGKLGHCLLPRTRNSQPRTEVDYYGDAARYSTWQSLRGHLLRVEPDAFDRNVRQFHQNAGIVTDKYRRLRWGMRSVGGSVVTMILAAVLHYYG